jgi:hypothetical protein
LKNHVVDPHVVDVLLALKNHARNSEALIGQEGIEGTEGDHQKNDNVIGIEKVSGGEIMRVRVERERVAGDQRRTVVEIKILMEVAG